MENGNFEGGTWRKTWGDGVYSEISVPQGWAAWWIESTQFSRPEMKVIPRDVPYLDPPRVYEGKRAVQWFSFYRRHRAGLFQRVTGLAVGAVYKFSAMVQAWYSQYDDPHQSEYDKDGARTRIYDGAPGMGFWLGVDRFGGQDPTSADIVWSGPFFFYDDYALISQVFEAATVAVTLFIRSECDFPFKHCDAYVDDARLERLDTPAPPVTCPGQPREDYARRYHVWPVDATSQRITEIKQLAGTDTCGPSYDDAMMGNITNKTAYLYDIPLARRSEFIAFRDRYYNNPSAKIVFADGGDPPIPPPLVKPVVPTGILVGWGTIGGDGQENMFARLAAQQAPPPSAKFVQDIGAAGHVKGIAPNTKIIGRMIDVEYSGRRYNVEGFDYSASANPNAQAETRMELLRETMALYPAVDYWEIVNEQQPPYPADIVKLCQFFIRAMQIAATWGKRLALFSLATGCPAPSVWDYALTTDVFRVALNGGHVISLHEYGLWPRDAGSHLLRCKALYDRLIPAGLGGIPLYITEYGVPREDWATTNKMAQIREYDAQLARLPYVGGAHIYVNQWDPPYGEYTRLYPEYEAYSVAVKGRVNG